jgi:hypothetical protein
MSINNTGLLHYYPLDTNILDYATGTGVSNATATNASISSSTTVLSSGSLLFNGSGSSGFTIPNTSFNSSGITLGMWMKMPATNRRFPWLFNLYNGNNYLTFYLNGSSLLLQYDKLQSDYNTSNSYNNLTEWNHYCVTIYPSGIYVLYFNGLPLYSSFQSTALSYPSSVSRTCEICVSTANGLSSPNTGIFNGNINQVVMFNRALSPKEVYILGNRTYTSSVVFSSSSTSLPSSTIKLIAANSTGNSPIIYSISGTDWYRATGTSVSGKSFSIANCVATDGTMWIVGTSNLTTFPSTDMLGPFWVSFDGNNWAPIQNQSNVKTFSNSAYRIGYGNGRWVAGGDAQYSGNPTIAYSNDGYLWQYGSGITDYVRAIIYKNSIWVVGTYNQGLYYSNDGITWTKNTQASSILTNVQGISVNDQGLWVAVGSNAAANAQIMYTSSVTGTWTLASSAGNVFNGNHGTGVAWDGTQFIVAGEAEKIASSLDGINWTVTTQTSFSTSVTDLVWSGSLWFSGQFANGGKSALISSPDGITWSTAVSNSLFGGGANITNIAAINFKFSYPCFREGTRILVLNRESDEIEYVNVERLKNGDLVKTLTHGLVPIHCIGHSVLKRPKTDENKGNRLYKFTPSKYPELEEDLYITGNHCILYNRLTPKLKIKVEEHMGQLFITEGKYRVPACLDEKALPYEEKGPATIWHFALVNNNQYANYGIFANGLLVESSSIRFMTECSNMELK